MANLSAYSTGPNSGKAVFSNLSVVNYARTVYLTVNNTPIGTQQSNWFIGASETPDSSYIASFSSLLANTSYKVNCTVYRNTPWEVVYSNSATFTTDAPPRPGNFYWYLPMVSGGDAEIDEDDWFYFKNKINEFRVYKGLSNYVYSYQPSSGDDLSAADFNQVRNALYGLRTFMTGVYSNGALIPAIQTAGSDVAAHYFINMQNSLNSIT